MKMTAQMPERIVYFVLTAVVHGPPGDNNFCPPPKNDAFFSSNERKQGKKIGKAEKGCFQEKNGFLVRKYASDIPRYSSLVGVSGPVYVPLRLEQPTFRKDSRYFDLKK